MSPARRTENHPLRRAVLPLAALLALAALAPSPAASSELRVHYAAIQKLLVRRMFQTEGRRYIQGSAETPCNFSSLQEPEVSAADGRLRIRMLFITRLGVPARGRCIGSGDEFHTVISGVPVYANGVIEMTDVQVDTEGRGYGTLIEPFVRGNLAESFRFPLQQRIDEAAQQMWGQTGVSLAVPVMDITEIRLDENWMVLPIEFRVVLR